MLTLTLSLINKIEMKMKIEKKHKSTVFNSDTYIYSS